MNKHTQPLCIISVALLLITNNMFSSINKPEGTWDSLNKQFFMINEQNCPILINTFQKRKKEFDAKKIDIDPLRYVITFNLCVDKLFDLRLDKNANLNTSELRHYRALIIETVIDMLVFIKKHTHLKNFNKNKKMKEELFNIIERNGFPSASFKQLERKAAISLS